MAKETAVDGFWVNGCNSLLHPAYLKAGEFSWSTNTDNSGGVIQTRQGFSRLKGLPSTTTPDAGRGMTVFTAKGKVPSIIVARGGELLHANPPFDSGFVRLPGVEFRPTLGPVTFTHTIKSINRKVTGELEVIDPIPLLIIQDGAGRALIWDGTSLVASDPAKRDGANGIPVGLWGQWSGGRYWVACGNKLRASNLGDPTTFTEEDEVASGGYFVLPDKITGMGQTPDFRNLLVFTDGTTSSFQSGILNRASWGSTNEFQKILFPGIGCAAGKSVVNQYGLTWWYSHNGLIGMDQAINTYRSSRLVSRDSQMMRSKGNMAKDISGICCGTFGNILGVSVPSGSHRNAHTWMFNQTVVSSSEQSPQEWMGIWTGVQPVEWVTTIINGQNRCFLLSNESKTSTVSGETHYHTNVWEAFIGVRIDLDGDRPQKIPCSFETRVLALSETPKKIEWAEADLTELRGNLTINMSYAGLRGGYKNILEKKIVSTRGSVNGPEHISATTTLSSPVQFLDSLPSGGVGTPATINVATTTGFSNTGKIEIGGHSVTYTSKTATTFSIPAGQLNSYNELMPSGTQVTQREFKLHSSDESELTSYVPQSRTVRSQTITPQEGCSSCAVESRRTEEWDRGFSLLLKWTGQAAITALRLAFTQDREYQIGACEEDEVNARYVTDSGCGEIDEDVIQADTFTPGARTSKQISIITPKHIDEHYSSFTPPV